MKVDERWHLRAGYSHQDDQVDALFTGNLGMARNDTFLQGRRVRQQIYTHRDDTFEMKAVGAYAWGPATLRLLLGAQYVARVFDNQAAQAPNDPALGSTPTASPLPLWDLRDPSTWNRDASVPLASLDTTRVDQTISAVDRSVHGGATLGLFEDRLLLLAGWRLTLTESRFTNHLTNLAQPDAATSMVTPQYGALFKLTPELSLYGSYAESFVPGTFVLNNPDGTTSPAAPSKGKGWDVGLKADFLAGRASGTLTWFDLANHNIVSDLAVTNSAGAVTIYNVQSGQQLSRGLELDGTFTPLDHWQLYLSYSYLYARITEFSGHDAAILAQDPATLDAAGQANFKNVRRFHGAPLQMSAPHLANLWTRYDFTGTRLQGLWVAGGANFVYDQTLLPDGPQSAHQTYLLLNATAGYAWLWRGHRLGVDVSGKNLLDEHYRPSQSTRSRPREFFLTLKVGY